MFYYALQFTDLIVNHKIHLFLLFGCYVWTIWFTKYYYSRKYEPVGENGYRATSSVIVPTFNEDPTLFDKCLKSIRDNNPTELFVMLDEHGDNNHQALVRIAHKYGAKVRLSFSGKRDGVAKCMREALGEIIILVDSDTILANKDTVHNLILPFKCREVGGVTSEQRVLGNSFFERVSDWIEDIRWQISNRAMSLHGVVGCLPGRAIALRKEYVLPTLDKFTRDYIFSWYKRKAVSGDDRCLTNLLLKQGYKTVYQSTSRCYTTAPTTLSKFIQMHIRWARTSQRYTLNNLKWMIHKHPILLVSFISDIITPFLFVIVLSDLGMNLLCHHNTIEIIESTPYATLFAGIILGIIGMNISLGLRYYVHLKDNANDWGLLPYFTLLLTGVMIPIRIYGFFTMWVDKWLTRD